MNGEIVCLEQTDLGFSRLGYEDRVAIFSAPNLPEAKAIALVLQMRVEAYQEEIQKLGYLPLSMTPLATMLPHTRRIIHAMQSSSKS